MSFSNLPGPRPRRGSLALLWSGLLLVLGLAGLTAAYLLSPVELKPGLSVTRHIGPKKTHFYRTRLAAGDALHVRVDQGGEEDGLDLEVKLVDPTGESVTMDGLNGGRFPEELVFVARTAGDHSLTLSSGGAEGRYRLDVLKLGPAGPDDRQRAEGLRLDQEAANLFANRDLQAQLALRYQALRLWRNLKDRGREAQELYQLGAAHVALDEIGPGVERLRESAAVWQSLGTRIEQARMLNEVGKALGQVGREDEALRSLDASFRLARELGGRPLQVHCLHDWGSILLDLGKAYRTRGRYENSRHSFEEALSLAQGPMADAEAANEATKLEAAAENELGGLLQEVGDLEKSIAHYERALAINRDLKDTAKVAATLNNMALVLQKDRKFQSAFQFFEKALDTKGLDQSDQATTLNNMAFLQIEMGDPKSALNLSKRAAQARPLADDPDTQAAILEARGLAQLKLGDLDFARQDLERGKVISDDHNLRSRQVGLRVGLGRVALVGGDLQTALGHFSEAVDLVESLRTGVQDADLRALLMAARRNPYDLCVETLVKLDRLEPGRGHGAESLQVNELGRARSLLDMLGAASLSRPASSRSLAEIQSEVLAPGVVLLEYALGENQSYLWAVTQDSLEIFDLPPRQKIDEVARPYYEKLRFRALRPEAGPAAWKEADHQADVLGARLSEMILAPVAGHLLGARTVLVVSDGALQYIPIAALPAPGTGERMIEKHAVVHMPSASVLASLRQEFARRQPAPRTLAVFYDPVFERADERFSQPGSPERLFPDQPADRRQGTGPRYPRLPSTQDEAKKILDLDRAPGQTFSATGFEASVEKVRRAPLDQYRFLHFATHGVIDSVHPKLSSLIFSQYDAQGRPVDGALSLPDIYNLRLNADCVVLSACDTALGREIRGEGLIGFTRAFLDAGSRRVLASLWSIDDRATAQLMERFYRSMLTDGNSPAVALQKAQIEMLRTKRSAPYYWAAFSLQGEWR